MIDKFKLRDKIELFLFENSWLNFEGADCSEIAEDLRDFLKKFNIHSTLVKIYVKGRENSVCLNIIQNGKIETFTYHYVLLCNNFIFDIKDLKYFISYGEYVEYIANRNLMDFFGIGLTSCTLLFFTNYFVMRRL